MTRDLTTFVRDVIFGGAEATAGRPAYFRCDALPFVVSVSDPHTSEPKIKSILKLVGVPHFTWSFEVVQLREDSLGGLPWLGRWIRNPSVSPVAYPSLHSSVNTENPEKNTDTDL